MRFWSLLAILLVLIVGARPGFGPAAAAEGADAAAVGERLLLDSGPIVGESGGSGGVKVFRGIPFAAPPVGALRWKPPAPVVPWTEARLCTAFSAVCPQPRSLTFKLTGPQDEDCLCLNVWTAARHRGDALPVFVWIHGGSFVTGAGSRPTYDGQALARQKVVVVTLNYRLGPLGFFGHHLLSAESPEHVSGNYGLLDQVAALEWVRRNIAAFGGDPGNVTICGESAGGSSVARLMVCARAQGLFHKAIIESGSTRGTSRQLKVSSAAQPALEALGQELEVKLGCDKAPDPLAALRAKTPAELIAAAEPVQGLFGEGLRLGPVVDGVVLRINPEVAWEARMESAVPLMIGTCENEGSIFVGQLGINRGVTYEQALERLLGPAGAAYAQAHPVTDKVAMRRELDRLLTAGIFLSSARQMAREHASAAKTWRFHFTRVPPEAFRLTIGAHHGVEIPYVFGTYGRASHADVDEQLSKQMTAAWARFAATGDPNGGDLPAWEPYDPARDNYLEFGNTIRAGAGLRTAEVDALAGRLQPGGAPAHEP